jgi:hypothetical protein
MVRVADALDACGIPYFLAGSFSSNYYGIPRSTKDADFVVQVQGALPNSFYLRLAPELQADPQLSFETNTGTYRQRFQNTQSSFQVELFFLSADAHDQARFKRRVAVELHNRRLWLPTAEDVIIMKLRWPRGRDADDIRGVIAVQADKLAWDYIYGWCDRHGTREKLDEIRRTVPKVDQ